MRLFLLPISTRRSLIYCEALREKAVKDRTLLDKATVKATETWAAWEKDEKAIWNWKKKVTYYGNQALSRIPYEEWALKSIPALTAKRKAAIAAGKEHYEVLFPSHFLKQDQVPSILKRLAQERQGMHRKRLIWSIVAMPFSAPFMLIPVIPNLPFFYLVYRAWSHWQALAGSRHLEFILQYNLPKSAPSWMLDEVYTAGLMYPTRATSRAAPRPTKEQAKQVADVVEQQTGGGSEDVMVLQRWNGKLIAEEFKLPALEMEIERAVEQVEKGIKAKEELAEEKLELERATTHRGQPAKDILSEAVLEQAEKRAERTHGKAEEVRERETK